MDLRIPFLALYNVQFRGFFLAPGVTQVSFEIQS